MFAFNTKMSLILGHLRACIIFGSYAACFLADDILTQSSSEALWYFANSAITSDALRQYILHLLGIVKMLWVFVALCFFLAYIIP